MASEKSRVHILVIPLPFHGHINPMLQFAKRIASKGPRVTLLVPEPPCQTEPGPVYFEPVSLGPPRVDTTLHSTLEWFRDAVPRRLREIAAGRRVGCVVYDSGAPWILGLARELGAAGGSFFTHSCAVACVYCHVSSGLLKIPLEEEARFSLPGLPVLGSDDLPSFVSEPGSYPALLELVISRFSNVGEADWIFFSSFEALEKEAFAWMRTRWPIMPIGPTIPSMYLDKRLQHDTDYHHHKNDDDPAISACTNWLDSKPVNSVAYVSFGSLAELSDEQTVEIAEGLRLSGRHFLWATKKKGKEFTEAPPEKGLVVEWCRQVAVLAHTAVGCFVTHCGWNSALEAVSLGVPMVAVPQWTDQRTNAMFAARVWGFGLRAEAGPRGVVGRVEIARCIREVMGGTEMRENAVRLRESAVEALGLGGSSDRNIDDFVSQLVAKKTPSSSAAS